MIGSVYLIEESAQISNYYQIITMKNKINLLLNTAIIMAFILGLSLMQPALTKADVTYYTITSSPGSNGSISVTGTVHPSYVIASGGSMTLNITPASGYQIGTLTIDNVSQA